MRTLPLTYGGANWRVLEPMKLFVFVCVSPDLLNSVSSCEHGGGVIVAQSVEYQFSNACCSLAMYSIGGRSFVTLLAKR